MATEFAVDILFRNQTKGIDEIERKLGGIDRKARDLRGSGERAFDGLDRGARKASSGIGGLAAGLGKLAAAYVSVDVAVRQVAQSINKTLDLAAAQKRLQAATSSTLQYVQAQQIAARAADTFGQSQLQSTDAISKVVGRLVPLGFNLREIETIYGGFNTAATLAGSSAAEAAGAFTQLTQALGAGALRGEEFNSIAEQAPRVLIALSKELGVPVGQLKELAAQGKITSDVVVSALERIRTSSGPELEAALDNPRVAVQRLGAAWSDLQVTLGQSALPSVTGGVKQLTGAIEDAIGEIKEWQRFTRLVDSDLEKLAKNPVLDWVIRLADALKGRRGEWVNCESQALRWGLRWRQCLPASARTQSPAWAHWGRRSSHWSG